MGDCRHSIGEAARQVRVFTPVAVYEGSVLPLACGLVTNNVRLTQPVSRCPPLRQVLVAVECSFAR